MAAEPVQEVMMPKARETRLRVVLVVAVFVASRFLLPVPISTSPSRWTLEIARPRCC